MISIDTSAILAILLQEPEEEIFQAMLAASTTVIGAPTLVEARLVMEGHFPGFARTLLHEFVANHALTIVSFDAMMFEAAVDAFTRFGKGRHPAKLNFGDCLSYAVARVHAVPLLFKGRDFTHTDLVPAYVPSP